MPESTPASRQKRTIITLTIVFAVVFYILIFQGGMCERYDHEMQQRENMRKYIDSMRTEEQKGKLER